MSSTAAALAYVAPLRIFTVRRYSEVRILNDDGSLNTDEIDYHKQQNDKLIALHSPPWIYDPRPWDEGGDDFCANNTPVNEAGQLDYFDELIRRIEAGYYGAGVGKMLNRFYRNPIEKPVFIRSLKRGNVLIFTWEGSGSVFDANQAGEELQLNVMGAAEVYGQQTKSDNIRDDVREAFEFEGGAAYHGSVRPLGFQIVNPLGSSEKNARFRTLRHDGTEPGEQGEAAMLLEAAERLEGPQLDPRNGYPVVHKHQGSAGEAGRAIAADLQARGFKGVSGMPITWRALRKALLNPAIAGFRDWLEGDPLGTWIPEYPGQKKPHGKRARKTDEDYPGNPLPGPGELGVNPRTGAQRRRANHQGILEPARWQQLCKILEDPARNTRTGERGQYWLTGKGSCGHCGRRAHITAIDGKLKIRCTPELVDGVSQGGCFSRDLAPVQAAVRARIFQWMAEEGLWDQSRFDVSGDDAKQLMIREKQLEADLKEWKTSYDAKDEDGNRLLDGPTYREWTARDRKALKKVSQQLDRMQQRSDRDPHPDIKDRRGGDFENWWKTLERPGDADGLAKRKLVLRRLAEEVVIYQQGKGHRVFDPRTVQVRPAAWHLGLDDPSAAWPAQPPPEITTAQGQVTAFLAAHPGESFTAVQLAEAEKYFINTVKTALTRLVQAGVAVVTGTQPRAATHPGQTGRGAYLYAIAPDGATTGDGTAEGRVLAFLAAHPGQSFTRAEISAATGVASSTLSRKMPELADNGTVTITARRGRGQPSDRYAAASRGAVAAA